MSRRAGAAHACAGRSGPAAQRGVALIIALILVALATILATKLTFDGWLERRRTIGIMATEQAYQFGMGAEALAADALNADRARPCDRPIGSVQRSARPRHTGQSAPAGQSDPSLGAAHAALAHHARRTIRRASRSASCRRAIEDMQGRFNLNNLAHVIQAERPVRSRIRCRSQQFQRLLVSVGLEPKWAGIARDWIDRGRSGRAAGRRGGRGLHLAESALPHRQLADDEPERAHEPARVRRRPLPQDRALRHGAADRHGQDQHLHGPGAGARKPGRQPERRVHRPRCSRTAARAAVFPTATTLQPTCSAQKWRRRSRISSRTPASISASLPGSRLALREFTLYSLLYRGQRRQGDAAAALFRNTLNDMPQTLLATPTRTRPRRDRVAEHRGAGSADHREAARPLEPGGGASRAPAKVVALAPATQILLAEPELPPGQRREARPGRSVRPGGAAHRGHRSAVLRHRAPPTERPHARRRGVAQRAAGVAGAARPRRASSRTRSTPISRWCRRIPGRPCCGWRGRASRCAARAACRSRWSSRRSPRPWWSPA